VQYQCDPWQKNLPLSAIFAFFAVNFALPFHENKKQILFAFLSRVSRANI